MLTKLEDPRPNDLQEFANLIERVRQYDELLPSAVRMLNPLWLLAGWAATTFHQRKS